MRWRRRIADYIDDRLQAFENMTDSIVIVRMDGENIDSLLKYSQHCTRRAGAIYAANSR